MAGLLDYMQGQGYGQGPQTVLPQYKMENMTPDINSSMYGAQDYLKTAGAGVNVLGGLYGLYGMHQQNKRANEAMGMARKDQKLRAHASGLYDKFQKGASDVFAGYGK